MSRYSIIACSASIARPHSAPSFGADTSRCSSYGSPGTSNSLRERLPSLDLDEQHPASARGEREGERRGNGGLAGASLARDHVQPRTRRDTPHEFGGGGHFPIVRMRRHGPVPGPDAR